MSDRPGGPQPPNDIYTVLLMMATVLMAGAAAFLLVRSQQLFGTWNPFTGA